jgi:hypothetical protein
MAESASSPPGQARTASDSPSRCSSTACSPGLDLRTDRAVRLPVQEVPTWGPAGSVRRASIRTRAVHIAPVPSPPSLTPHDVRTSCAHLHDLAAHGPRLSRRLGWPARLIVRLIGRTLNTTRTGSAAELPSTVIGARVVDNLLTNDLALELALLVSLEELELDRELGSQGLPGHGDSRDAVDPVRAAHLPLDRLSDSLHSN